MRESMIAENVTRSVTASRITWELGTVDRQGFGIELIFTFNDGQLVETLSKWESQIKRTAESGILGMSQQKIPVSPAMTTYSKPKIVVGPHPKTISMVIGVEAKWESVEKALVFDDLEEALMEGGYI